MKLLKNNFVSLIIITVILFIIGICSLNFIVEDEGVTLSNDDNMVTNYLKCDIVVNDDNTYLVNEDIKVSFLSPKHGIYRYIPYLGKVSRADSEGFFEKVPYYANIDLLKSNEKIHSIDNKNGNKCITFGDEDKTLTGDNEYSFEYKVTPKAQGGYTTIYYNIFPTYWQNKIPAGSEFSVTFPKETPKNIINLYYGKYGQNYNASSIIDFSWEENKLNGILKEDLPLGSGLTLYAPVGDNYFDAINTINSELNLYIISLIIVCIMVAALFFMFGKGERIIPVIQFNPPKNLDSAASGFIIDGYADDEDIISLLLYLADKGYLKINKKSKEEIELIKVKNIDVNMPQYIKIFFDGVFGKNKKTGKAVKLSSLKYKFQPSLAGAKESLKDIYDDKVYTKSSKVCRIICCILCILPLGIFTLINNIFTYTTINTGFIYLMLDFVYGLGVILLCACVDSWYSINKARRNIVCILGLIMCLSSLVCFSYYYFSRTLDNLAFRWYYSLISMIISTIILSVFTVFMKKRSLDSIKLMNYLIGFKDFIEKTDLDRIKYLADKDPDLFYNVLPYAYVFGLSHVWIKKFENIAVKQPEWYSCYDYSYNYLNINSMIMSDLKTAKSVCSSVQSSKNSSNSDSSWGGGSSRGGGFSGGGFGGGGGGSW